MRTGSMHSPHEAVLLVKSGVLNSIPVLIVMGVL
jgi:hypothetical protein